MAKFSAYQVAKRVFNEHYVKKGTAAGQRGRIEELFDGGEMKPDRTHGLVIDYRVAIDLMFLAGLDNEARKAGDTALATQVQNLVEYTVDRLHKLYFVNGLADKTTWPNSLNIIYPIKAMVFIKFFMNGSKKGTPLMTKVDEIRMASIRRAVDIYKTFVWKGHITGTLQQIVQNPQKLWPTQNYAAKFGNIQPATVLNGLAVLGGALGLNSYLVGNQLEWYTTPTDYGLRNDISDLGNYIYHTAFGDSVRRQCNYGGVPSATDIRAEYVISGYSSWVAGHIPLIAHGTVYPTNFWERSASSFQERVPQFFRAFQDTFNVFGFLPDTTKEFAEDRKVHSTQGDHTIYPPDTTPYMYTLAYYGDQNMIDWIEYKTVRNAQKDPARAHADNGVDLVPGEAVIEAVIRRDLKNQTLRKQTAQAFTTRALEGLAAGLFKRLQFNDQNVVV